MKRRWTPVMTAMLIWLVNPTLGGCDGQEFSFGESEMLALLDTLNSETWSDDGYSVDLDLEQSTGEQAMFRAPWTPFQSAHACGNRSFVAEAAACIETSSLPLEGTVTVTDLASGESVTSDIFVSGEILVAGYALDNAEVTLSHDTGTFYLRSRDGETFTLQGSSW